MVDVRVGDHDRVEAARIERRLTPVAQPQLLESLEQAAVEQHAAPARGHQVHGAGDRFGGAEELDRGGVRHQPNLHLRSPP